MNPIKAFVGTLSTSDKHIKQNATESLHHIAINSLQGHPIDLSEFKGRKILFVNVASKCGFTPQYRALQELSDTYKDKLVVIGVPCNQFGKQEPGTSNEIQEFCDINYGVTFLMTEKIDVKGLLQHPLYAWLTKKAINGKQNSTVKWNFQKYLVDEDGEFLDYFYSITKPMNSRITSHLK
ncbi:glutathione peroxidase [Winogradskyella haliclonae]|uniref:Glutathione peroxidase n=1 Tax=Winogradskyella haliclonae TaxID=2048558 RepID=A0ABQ2BZK5_9FLAO|nr:glutathione peroxidase [Winogradskyella haliclonae]GGI57716.1 glutathione peroxidase [Winogradskyella haliclonae]